MMLRSLARQWVLPFVDPRQLASILRLPQFLIEWRRFCRTSDAPARFIDLWPCLGDRTQATPFDPHYFYQAAWLARLIAESRPSVHVDVGSRVTDIGVLSAHVPVIFVDYRPLNAQLPGLVSVAGDITRLPFADGTLSSVSSLHVIEHIGLGRYGDPIEPAGALKGLGELQRVLAHRGSLYLSTPVGRERICFNAQRIFAPETILGALPLLRLRRFSYVGDDRKLHVDAPLADAAQQDYGCGLFEFERS
jgi:SAM-dependent methyltransferase